MKMMEGKVLKALTGVCICHLPLAKEENRGAVSVESKRINSWMEMEISFSCKKLYCFY